MKNKIRRKTMGPITTSIYENINEVNKEYETLKTFLVESLTDLMAESLDPDIANNSATTYVNNLTLNKLGDFNKRYILTSGGEKPNGILIGIRKENIFYITSLGVKTSHRNKGIATQLLEASRIQMRKENIEFIELDVHSLNEPAVKLYRKYGFK